MKIDVFDTHVMLANGQCMHFDILLPAGSPRDLANRYALKWLGSIAIEPEAVSQQQCHYCHSEGATPEQQRSIHTQGYAVIQMEGCPAPV
ncbi:MAG: DUF2024 family protein [Gammaproteobacteria bacterium]|nr:MAG: DUF2024 family protein [Gammaproteobacteria bacterium]